MNGSVSIKLALQYKNSNSIWEEKDMKKINVYVTLRESVVDPQGTAAKDALHTMGFTEVGNVRIGKLIELKIDETTTDIDARVKEMCEKLLVNKVIEDYRYEIEEVASK
jgi:phosphoribosylformylglycinamidine synthase PurS subunit